MKYLKGIIHLHDNEIEEFAEKNKVTIDQLMKDMVEAGWSQGANKDGEHEYWEND